jgi:ABC-type spermidine/putrescine transport system permease subunit II
VEALALAVWVGGLASIIAAVIPAVFTTIGMETGGRMLTRTFQGYDRLVLVSAGLIVAGTLVRVFVSGPWREQIGMIELALLAIMVVFALTLTFWLTPETTRLQELAFSAKEEAKRAAYDEFFVYHRVARALYILNLGLGIAVLCVKVRKWVR